MLIALSISNLYHLQICSLLKINNKKKLLVLSKINAKIFSNFTFKVLKLYFSKNSYEELIFNSKLKFYLISFAKKQ